MPLAIYILIMYMVGKTWISQLGFLLETFLKRYISYFSYNLLYYAIWFLKFWESQNDPWVDKGQMEPLFKMTLLKTCLVIFFNSFNSLMLTHLFTFKILHNYNFIKIWNDLNWPYRPGGWLKRCRTSGSLEPRQIKV